MFHIDYEMPNGATLRMPYLTLDDLRESVLQEGYRYPIIGTFHKGREVNYDRLIVDGIIEYVNNKG